MKAWTVGGDFVEGVWLVHAETRDQAKSVAYRHTDIRDFDPDYIDLRAKRCGALDDKPFTVSNAETVLYLPDAIDEDGEPYSGDYCTRAEYRNCCPCEICRTAKKDGEG